MASSQLRACSHLLVRDRLPGLYFKQIQKLIIGALSLWFCGHTVVRKASASGFAKLWPLVGYTHSGFNTQTKQGLLPMEICPSRKLKTLQPDKDLGLIKTQNVSDMYFTKVIYYFSLLKKKSMETKDISKVKPLVGLMRSLYGSSLRCSCSEMLHVTV